MNSARALVAKGLATPMIVGATPAVAPCERDFASRLACAITTKKSPIAQVGAVQGDITQWSGFDYAAVGVVVGLVAGPMIAFTVPNPLWVSPLLAMVGGQLAGQLLVTGDGTTTDNLIAFAACALGVGGGAALGVGLSRILFHFGPYTLWPAIGWTAGYIAASVVLDTLFSAGTWSLP